ncbi:MAG TPA: anthranilate phosphoribosyltransferase [Rariglobus sp.]|jgi:anthranilate phosphoribosyltransferase|nr:anthranilate phosphoribosyltransferase [Rariglobus sp.]
MPQLSELTRQLLARQELTSAEVADASAELASPEVADEGKAAFLAALGDKGETAAEVAAFAREFRARAINPGVEAWADEAIDIVGTGGDLAGGFNISSMVVLTLACAGVPVMKHGNRGVTSKCGSADLLAALGVDLQAPPEKQRAALGQLGYAFFFAPAYHPAFKHIAPVRKLLAAQGRRSVFNILGPLINPGRPGHVLLGVFSDAWVTKLADVFDLLGTKAGLAAHGVIEPGRGIDELTTTTSNHVRGIGRLRAVDGNWDAADYGFVRTPFSDLQGGDLAVNMAIVDALLAGRAPAGLVDTIVFNTAVALWITGRIASPRDAIEQARELLLGGAVRGKISATKDFFAA